jgi:hypothetical protein
MTKADKPARAPRLPVYKPTSKAATKKAEKARASKPRELSDRPVGRPKVELAPRTRQRIVSALTKTRNINQTVVALAQKGESVSAGKVREVATKEGIELARNVRLQQAPAVLKMAKQLRKAGQSAAVISEAIKVNLDVTISPHYINTLLRRAAK